MRECQGLTRWTLATLLLLGACANGADAPSVAVPQTGTFKLVLDTDDSVFTIFTFGVGVSWTTEAGKTRSIDFAVDTGGDNTNVALGYNHEF